jgi:beta-N-acetylhexosaminidase
MNIQRFWMAVGIVAVLVLQSAGAQTIGLGDLTDSKNDKGDAPAPEPDPGAAAGPSEGAATDPVTALIQTLSLQRRVAQLMIVSLQGSPLPNSTDVQVLARYTPGGVIVPPMLRPVDARDYVAKLLELPVSKANGIPLLIGTNLYDLPKGRHQPNAFFTQLPSLLSIAAANDPAATERLAGLIADQLSVMGFNLNLGPSLELAPVLPEAKGTLACLGSDPTFAANAGCAILKALTDKGIVAVPMGFPGGGSNRLDRDPAVLLTPAGQLLQQDVLPFQRAIEQGADIIHVANTYVPTLDRSGKPASLSTAVMHDLLRNRLHFNGVILAGPLDTSDVARYEDPSKAAITALKAGADMLLWNEAGSRVLKTVDEIVQAVKDGQLSQEVIDNALRRVLELKRKRNLLGRPLPDPKLAERFGRKEFPEAAYEIERRAITLVQNRGNALPLNDPKKMAVGVTGEVGVEALHEALTEYLKVVVQQPIRTAKYAGRVMDFEIDRIAGRVSGIKTAICVYANSGHTPGKVQLVRELQAKGIRVIVVLLGYPSHLPAYGEADAIVVAYCSESAYDQTMKAVADVLVGQGPLAVLPIERDLKTETGRKQVFNPLEILRAPAGALPVTINERYVAGLYVPYDPTFSLKKARWDFGDGSKSKDLIAEHAYKAPGRYPITVTLVDKKGNSTKSTFHATVE